MEGRDGGSGLGDEVGMIQLENIRKVFNEDTAHEMTAVNGIQLHIARGTMTVLKGPSGSGKTTLLSIIGGMARPTAGRILLSGREITSLPERFLTMIRRTTFGFIFQHFNLIKGISVLENVMLPAYPSGVDRSSLVQRAHKLLSLFGIEDKARAKVQWLSGGEAQRAAVCRALINDPEVLIADEPTAHLDSVLSREFMESMSLIKAQGRTVVIASHDPIVYEWPSVDSVVEMRDGLIVHPEAIQ